MNIFCEGLVSITQPTSVLCCHKNKKGQNKKKPTMPRYTAHRRWCFTINNPTAEEKAQVATALTSEGVTYGIVGREVAASGTPHLQGFVIFANGKSLNVTKRLIGDRAHLEITRGTSQQAADYCKKDGDYDEYGTIPQTQGKRSDLEKLVEWSDDFERDNGRPPESPDVAQAQPAAYVKYPRFTRMCAKRSQRNLFPPLENLYLWQSDLMQVFDDAADEREVIFVVDHEGGKGKTSLIRHILSTFEERVTVLTNGKASDLSYTVKPSSDIFLFNIPRGGMEFLSYHLIEGLKDRIVFSQKYTSEMKYLLKTPHVIVFCNEQPDRSKMTADRYVVREI